jgi:hypothetical protein
VEMVIEPAHRVLDGDVKIPERVLLGHWMRRQTSGSVPLRAIKNW